MWKLLKKKNLPITWGGVRVVGLGVGCVGNEVLGWRTQFPSYFVKETSSILKNVKV